MSSVSLQLRIRSIQLNCRNLSLQSYSIRCDDLANRKLTSIVEFIAVLLRELRHSISYYVFHECNLASDRPHSAGDVFMHYKLVTWSKALVSLYFLLHIEFTFLESI